MSAKTRWTPPESKERINWETVAGLPLSEYEKGTRDISTLDEWIDLALQFRIDETDRHFTEARYSSALARLYRLVLSKCDHDANEMYSQKEQKNVAAEKVREQLNVAEERIQRLLDEKALSAQAIKALEDVQEEGRNERGKLIAQIQTLSQDIRSKERDLEKAASDAEATRKELNRMTRERDDLRRAAESRSADATRSDADRSKIYEENQFLIKRFKETADKLTSLVEVHAKLERDHREYTASAELEVSSLKQQLTMSQQENQDLVLSRNRAEELCEQREVQALNDMSELQQAYKELLTEEQRKYQDLKDEYLQLRDEYELNQRSTAPTRELEEKDDVIAQLKNEIRLLRSSSHQDVSVSGESVQSASSFAPLTSNGQVSDFGVLNKVLAERQRLEQENDSLKSDLTASEIKCEQQDAQLLKLQKRLNEYERGDEGLRRLRQELADANRASEQLQDETQQLRTRLAHMEDVAALCTSLKLLCKRVGVTQEEIDRLQGSTNTRFGELDVLRQETASLKEEIEWLEKERRYWMNKVRLQPLLDTRLRFELGLTSEQLKQLDHIVDQMKAGSSVVEDTEGVYREKYLHEVKERQRDIEEFNDKMRARIEEVLASVMASATNMSGGVSDHSSASFAQILEEMRRHSVEAAAVAAGAAISAGGKRMPAAPDEVSAIPYMQNSKQLESMKHKMEEVERMNSDLIQDGARLRETIAALESKLSAVSEERDAYRAVVFDAATAGAGDHVSAGALAHNSASTMHSMATSGSPPRRYGKDISPILQEQLKTKELRVQQLSADCDALTLEVQTSKGGLEAILKERDACVAHNKSLQDQATSLTATLRMSSERISELEKLNDELQQGLRQGDLAPTSRELLQKIVLLRQRESKLLQRLRIAAQERDDAIEQNEKHEQYIESTLVSFKALLSSPDFSFGCSSTSAVSVVLPSSTVQHASETEALRVLQAQMTKLASGAMFVEDRKYLSALRDTVDRMDAVSEASVTAAELRAVKLESEREVVQLHEKIVELEAAITRLRSSGAQEPPQGSVGALETEASTWRQKCALYTKRLADRDSDLQQVEDQLNASRAQVVECKHQLETLQALLANVDGDASSGHAPHASATTDALKYEKEIARLKSLNFGLLQSSLDLQAEKKKLSIKLAAADRHLQLVQNAAVGGPQGSAVVSDFVVSALRDNANLQQQCEMALTQLKKVRLQLLITESNFRVVANEAGAYKLSAHRLFKSYAEQVVKLVDATRQAQRTAEGSLSVKRAEALVRRVGQSLYLAEMERHRVEREAQRALELESQIALLKDELDIVTANARGGPLGSAGETIADKNKLADLRAELKCVRRQLLQVTEERDFALARLSRTEAALTDAERDAARLELASSIADGGDNFLQKLLELRDTVFARSEAPPIAVTVASSPNGGSSFGGGIETDSSIREFKEALDRQAELSKRCSQLQQEATTLKNQLHIADAKNNALQEEYQHAQQQVAAVLSQATEEKQKALAREERIAAAHQAQIDVMQRAVEHNTQCLKELIAGKERTIVHLQEQLNAERQRYLEHQLLDTTKMERLHEQLFRENNAMMERFKISVEEAAAAVQNNSNHTPAVVGSSSLPEATHQQLQRLTQDTLQLQMQVKELRTRNIMLESQLNDQIAVSQQQVREALNASNRPGTSGGVVEASLLSVTRDQSVALDNLRHREHELLRQLQHAQEEVKVLHQENFDLRNQLIDQVDATSRGQLALINGNQTSSLLSQQSISQPNLANELRLQVAELSRQLAEARNQLAYERAHVKHASSQSEEYKRAMQQLEQDMTRGTVHVDSARQILATNQQLRSDIDAMKDQSEKMLMASALLKQKLVEQTQTANEREQKLQQELAIAQRMTVLQQQSAENITSLQARVASMQDELQKRLAREEDLLRKGKSAQEFAEEQHRLLLARDKELIDLKRMLQHERAARGSTVSVGGGDARSAKHRVQWQDAGVQVVVAELSGTALLPGVALQAAATMVVPSLPSQAAGGAWHSPQQPSVGLLPLRERLDAGVQTDASPSKAATRHSPQSRKTSPVGVHDTSVLPHVAGVVGRQVMQAQKEKQAELDGLRLQVRKLELDMEDCSRRFESERATLTSKANAATAASQQLKQKLDEAEHAHRVEVLKFLEERRHQEHLATLRKPGSRRIKPELLTARNLQTAVVRDQYTQTQTPAVVTQTSSQSLPIPILATTTAVPSNAIAPTSSTATRTPAADSPIAASGYLSLPPALPALMAATPAAASQTPAQSPTLHSAGCQTELQHHNDPIVDTRALPATKKWVELQSATNDLKLQEALRKLRKENERLGKQLADAVAQSKEIENLREELRCKIHENALLQSKMATHASQEEVASPLEIRHHKRDILRLEEYIDRLRRDVNVKKEMELRELILKHDRLVQDVAQLESENARLRTGGRPTSDADPPPHSSGEQIAQIRELENKLLEQEGLLLDLRFERETLTMKASRLERHLHDILAVDNRAASSGAYNGGKTPPGSSPRGKALADSQSVSALQGVIENLKLVVERLQSENMSLKANGVSSAQFLEATREVKTLRMRERHMLEKISEQHHRIEELQGMLVPGSKMSEHVATLQRRLRAAQATSEAQQLELLELKTRLAAQPPPQGVPQRPADGESLGTMRPSPFTVSTPEQHLQMQRAHAAATAAVSMPLSPRQYAPELHHLLPHHH